MQLEAWAQTELEALDAQSLTRAVESVQVLPGGLVLAGGQTLINLSSNDYLGLALEPSVRQAAMRAVEAYGAGSGSSRLVVGDSPAHQALERALATFKGTETALLFNSGYVANTGLLTAMLGPGDVVFSDALNHASIVDGCRLSRARVVVYPHADVEALEALIRQHAGRRRLVVTDAVFSMDGDRAPLKAIRALCDTHGLALMVDEAHSAGVLGATGAGLCELEGVSADVQMGTLSKAFGSMGAYVACSHAVRSWLLSTVRPVIFSTALPPSACAAAHESLRLLREDPARRVKLNENIRFFAEGLQALGVAAAPASPIFSVVLGSAERALAASAHLRTRGVLAKAIRPPTVPEGTSRLRISVSAVHERAQLQHALSALAEILAPVRGVAADPLSMSAVSPR